MPTSSRQGRQWHQHRLGRTASWAALFWRDTSGACARQKLLRIEAPALPAGNVVIAAKPEGPTVTVTIDKCIGEVVNQQELGRLFPSGARPLKRRLDDCPVGESLGQVDTVSRDSPLGRFHLPRPR